LLPVAREAWELSHENHPVHQGSDERAFDVGGDFDCRRRRSRSDCPYSYILIAVGVIGALVPTGGKCPEDAQ
jgi:hypothetical protein